MSELRRRILASAGANSATGIVRHRIRGEVAETVAKSDKLFSLSKGASDNYTTELMKASKARLRPYRHGTHTHVSDVIHKCVRKLALTRRLGVLNPSDRMPEGQSLTFAQGDAIHDYVKKRFIDGYPDRVWAQWSCPCGDTTVGPVTYARRPKKPCTNCGKVPATHVEYALFDEEYEVVGSPDLVLYLDEFPAYYVDEIKSMTAKQWDVLERPVPDHVIQSTFYWFLMRKLGYSMVDQLSITYVKKEWSFKWPYKEFIVKPLENEKVLDPFLDDLKALVDARDPGAPLPPRVFCATQDAPEAKKCSVCVSCFNHP